MIEKSVSGIWWEEIYGPRLSRKQIYQTICLKKPVVFSAEAVPWPRTLISLIRAEIQENLGIYLEEINGNEKIENPGEYLLRKFGKREEINKYRAGVHPSLPEYIRNIGALENKLVFVSGVTTEKYKLWEKFIVQYKPKNEKGGLFLIEAKMPLNTEIAGSGRTAKIDIMSSISFYDILSFSILLASQLPVNEILKQYTAWTTSLLFNRKIETIAEMYSEKFIQSSFQDYHRILQTETNDELFFSKSLWTAQLQILFPVIENLRLKIINSHRADIEYILQTEDCYYCDRKITDPYDAELGFLVYLSWKNQKKVFTAETAKNIQFLNECRNRLAHHEYCDAFAINKIIDLDKEQQ